MSASSDVDVTFSRGPQQCRLPAARFLRVHVGTAGEEEPHGLETARACSGHQHRFAAWQQGIRIGARIQIPLDDGRITVDARDG